MATGYRLPAKVLNNLPALFRNLPDNHYKIYLVQSETNARRLVIEVFVRNGKLIDPGDDSEGARDRPPTEEATTRPVEEQPAAAPAGEAAAATQETPCWSRRRSLRSAQLRPRSSSADLSQRDAGRRGDRPLRRGEELVPNSWKRPSPGRSRTSGNGSARPGTPRPKKPR